MALPVEVKIIGNIIAAIIAAITAWEIKDRLNHRNKKIDKELEDNVMSTTMIVSDNGKEYKKTATVNYRNEKYSLEIISDESGTPVKIHNEEFISRESLENYLNENTSFRMGDFVSR